MGRETVRPSCRNDDRDWTPDAVATLKRLVRDGTALADIALIFGRSPDDICARVQKEGIIWSGNHENTKGRGDGKHE